MSCILGVLAFSGHLMELVKLLKGGDKTCHKHSYLRDCQEGFAYPFFS